MQRFDGRSMNVNAENIDKLKSLFPEIVTEEGIDFDKLRAVLGEEINEDYEKYEFAWKGKMEALKLAGLCSVGTLLPCKEESKNWENTQNLYIEGDNLEVLKLLQQGYHGKIKMIYIDPPYNTGHDFIYKDSFSDNITNYKELTEQMGKSNPETSGRYHTNWLNMIYPRLLVAKTLLRDDGVIFISIDDNEVHNLRKLCDEVFGEGNFVAQLVWERAYAPKNDAKYISNSHDYVLMYAKALDSFQIGRLERTEEANARYQNPDNDPRGVWKPSDMSVKTYSAEYDYAITIPSGRVVEPPTGRCWRFSKKSFIESLHDNRIWFGSDGNSVPCIKRFLTELKFEGMTPQSLMLYKDVGHSQEGAKEVTKLLEAGAFDGPKPVRLLKRLLTLANTGKDSIILDFFSGSATTAHAVMQFNAEDGGKRRFIMVQLPEKTDEKSEAYQAGYATICDIGKERIRRAGDKIMVQLPEKTDEKSEAYQAGYKTICDIGKERIRRAGDKIIEALQKDKPAWADEESNLLDIGFKVFKLDTSNIKRWDSSPLRDTPNIVDTILTRLNNMVDTIRADRTELDIIYEILLKFGIDLNISVEKLDFEGFPAYVIGEGLFIVCLEANISIEMVETMADSGTGTIVFAEECFQSDTAITNAELILKDKNVDIRVI